MKQTEEGAEPRHPAASSFIERPYEMQPSRLNDRHSMPSPHSVRIVVVQNDDMDLRS